MKTLKALIFDLDGVIVNTVDLHYRAWWQVFSEIGVDFRREDMERLRGIHRRQILESVADGYRFSETETADFLLRKDDLYKQFLREVRVDILHVPVVTLLHEGKAHGLKIGLASSSINAHHVLEIVQLRHLFDAAADGNTVCRSKPAPDIFVWTAGALGVTPREVVVVEDGSAGVQGALSAGMFVVGIDVAEPAPHLNVAMSDLRFDQIAAAYARGSHHDIPTPAPA
jgi:beta-phosphoglucomutase